MPKRKRLNTTVKKGSTTVEEENLNYSQAEFMYGDTPREMLEQDHQKKTPFDTSRHERFGTSVSNGREFLRNVDGRTWRARQMKAAYESIISDLGGIDQVTFAQAEIARRVSALHVLGLEQETALALDDKAQWDFDQYVILSRTQSQLLKLLGLDRKEKQLNGGNEDDLDSYLRRQAKYSAKNKNNP